MLVASLLGPALLFAYAAVVHRGAILHQTEERLERALDIMQEHTLKALQTVERTIAETNEVLRDLPDEAIRADEERFRQRLKRTQIALPQIEAIWAFDARGRPLVASAFAPVPRDLDNSDRDYFRAQVSQDAGTYVGEVITARIGGMRFFVVSQRRPDRDGRFDGIVAVSVNPGHFAEFYKRMGQGIADSFGLIRTDGVFLARHPFPQGATDRLNAQSRFMQAVQARPEAGAFLATSQIDGIERRIGYRKVPGYPLYVQAGIEMGAIWRELRQALANHLVFGVPATLLLFGLSYTALRRTRGLQAEVARREVAEAALKQAQRLEALGQLTGGVAHDFNNILMVVKGHAERLRRTGLDDRQRRSLEAIENAAARGAGLTRQLLSFSRQQTHAPIVIDLRERLPALQDMLRPSLRGDVAIETTIAADLWPVRIDPSEFELAILNVAVNARDAMPGGGRLVITAENVRLPTGSSTGLTGDHVAIRLADTGTGIPQDVLPRVFEPFFTTKEVGRGTGLGLSQVYGFARQSGGTATVSSEPGHGTTINLFLPRSREEVQAAAPRAGEPVRRTGRGRVLLVEDNAEVAEITKANLEDLGYEVRHVANGAQALDELRPDHVDLVLSDIVMPGPVSGLDLARAVRDRHPNLPILLVTGYSTVAQEAADDGFPLLRKPYELGVLDDAIRAALGGRVLPAVA
jgi:two-component system NtrC family sensor kinase